MSSRGRHSIGSLEEEMSSRASARPPDSTMSTLSMVTSQSPKGVTSRSREAIMVCLVPEKMRE